MPVLLDLREHNENSLSSAPSIFMQTFTLAVDKYPVLNQVMLAFKTPQENPLLKYTPGFMESPDQFRSPLNPEVVINGSIDADYSTLFTSRYWTFRNVATQLGIDFLRLRSKPDLIKGHVFLHELAHAYQYLTEYLPKNSGDEIFDPGKAMSAQFRQELLLLPYPGVSVGGLHHYHQSGELGSIFELYRVFFKNQGITSINDLLKVHEEKYKTIPLEKFADDFASDILRTNRTDFGF